MTMKKTLTILTIAGVMTSGFLITNGQACSSSTSESIQTLAVDNESTKALNRLEGALTLAEALNIKPISPIYKFVDVPSEYQGIVNALVDSGIVGPIADTYFGSEEVLDRGETAIWINAGFSLPNAKQTYEFTDVNALCTQDVANAVENGIIEPTGYDDTFGMFEEVTSEQLSLYLERATSLFGNQIGC